SAPQNLIIRIDGTNDLPVVSGISSASVIEQGENVTGTANASGTLTATDLDSTDGITWAVGQPQGKFGDLSIDQHGNWSYQLDNSTGSAADKLAAGQQPHESFWVTATDSSGAAVPHRITVDVTGSNDKPVVSSWTQLAAGTEDKTVTIKVADLLTHATDVDATDTLQVSQLQASHGHLINNNDGSYSFTPDKDYNGEVRLTYNVVDGHGGSVSTQAKFNLAASPDNAVITDAQADLNLRGVTEDRGYIDTHYQLHYDGQLNIQDPDTGEAQFDPNIGPQTYQGIGYDTKLGGHVLLMQDGHYTYTLDNRNIQNLAEGEVKQDSVVIRSADGTTHTIELTVHGTNDRPTIAAQSHSVAEGGNQLNGQMIGQDVDTGAQLHYSAAQTDGLTLNSDGSYSFDPNHASYQSLALGVTKTLTIPVTITDEHNASSTQNLSITITGVNNAATISGVATGDVDEGHGSFGDMSPDYAQPGMAKLGQSALTADGKLNIVDPDTGESQFDPKGGAWNNSYHGQYGHLLLNSDGTWHYDVTVGSVDWVGNRKTTIGTTIDELGENQTLTDTITVYSKDGTAHDIVITIHGDNDRPYISSEVTLATSTEDTALTFTKADLLANTVDVDANDAGKLSIANLLVDHGSVVDNKDGTYTFTPAKDYNGQVHFSYDVQDAHGGVTHTGASSTLTATPDGAIISEVTTEHVIEDGPHSRHNAGVTTELANGQLQVIDPDSGEDKFQYSQFGETAIHDPFGGMLRIDSVGNWGYSVDNAALQHLAQGQTETVVYRVSSYDGTAYELHIDVVGTNDAPIVTQVALSNGTEDTHYQMQASQFGFTDIDTGDTLHSVAITDLPPATQGKFLLDGHDVTAGQHIPAADISKLQFIPAQDFNGDVQFKYTVNDGHTDSIEATNTVHFDAVADAAVITGTTTGDVDEGHGTYHDRSPNYAQPGMAKLTNDPLYADGKLEIIDPDTGEAQFDTKGVGYSYHGTYGQLILNADGNWHYKVTVGSNQQSVATQIDQLGDGQKLTDTITVFSKDGTAQNIVITIHGDNDRPYCSSEVTLAAGTEDTQQTITLAQLLKNTIDVDANDAGKLSIANLLVDHGSVVDNKDGTYTFTPAKDYNGQVHFSYDVQDAHGGVTHTGATTSLSAVADKAVITGTDTGAIIEDHNVGHSSLQPVTASGLLSVTDPDAGQDHFQVNLLGEQAIHDPFSGFLRITPSGAWGYEVANSRLQSLSEGEVEKVVYRVYSADHTAHDITITVTGTNDQPTITATTLAHGTEDTYYQMQASQFGFSDIDTGDTLHSVAITDLPSVAQGKFVLDGHDVTAGQHIPTADISKLQFIPTKDFNGDVQFKYTVNDGHVDSQEATNTLHINAVGDKAVISGVDTGDVHEGHTFTAPDGSMTGGSVDDRSPDHMHGNIGKLWNDEIHTDGHLTIVDADTGESHAQTGVYYGSHGRIILQTNGDWTYYASIGQDATGRAIDHLGKSETLTDTVTVKSADGTTHDIVITIHGDNDRPYCSSEVQLNSGKEDLAQTITASELLTNTVDVDTNDIGKLTVANLHVEHGSLRDNHDGTYTLTPEKDYNGQVHISYDVKDAHGGVSHTGATTTLTAVGDSATFSGADIGSIKEDRHVQGDADQSVAVSGVLNVTDPDANENEFVASRNVHAINDPLHGHLTIGRAGDWTYSVPNANLNHLAEGETVQVTYQVRSRGGDTHNITVDVVGTNDAPAISVHTLAHGSEDISYQMQASQFGFTDVDNKDTLHSVSITDQPDPSEGKFMLDGQDISTNQVIAAGDISKLQFVPAHNFNGDVGFSYTVNDGHVDSAKASNTLHITPVNDAATIDGQTQSTVSASITEDSATSTISGQLTLVDPDTGEDKFAANTQFSGQYGQLAVDEDGSWHYALNNASPLVNMLNAGQQLTDTITVTSPDGTASKTIAITIHGHSDTPTLQLQEAGATQGLDLYAGIQGNGISQLQYSTDGINFSSQLPAGFSLGSDGHTLEVDPANSSYDHLANGAQHKIWVNYQLQEGSGSNPHQSSQQAQVVITGTSDAPVIHSFNANSDQYSGPVTGNLLQGASDIDDGAQLILQDLQFKDPNTQHYITVHAGQDVSITGVGTIHIATNGDYRFTADASFTGNVPEFIYRVVDTHGDYKDNSQNTLNIHINANHQPTVQTISASTAEDTDYNFSAASFGYQDSDNDALADLTITQLPDPSAGSLMLNGQTITQGQTINANDIDHLRFRPAANFNGDAHFSYVANDGHQDSAAHTAVLTVTAVNDLPVLTINQTSHTQGNLVATDVDTGDTHTFSAPIMTGSFGSLSVDPDSGAYIYTQNNSVAHMSYNPVTATYSGVDVFEVKVSDNHGGVASQFISFNAQATLSSTAGTVVITSSVPAQPLVTDTLPSGHIATSPITNHVSIDLSANSDSGSANSDNLTHDTTPTITGHTDIPFSRVTIYDGNNPVAHALSDASGDYSATLTSLTEGLHNLSAKALAPSSIMPAVSSVLDVEIDTQANATIQLDPITSDNIINAQESATDIGITGQVSGDVHQGDSVSLVVGQHSYSATVDGSGHFSVNIAGSELASNSSITASVVTTDSAGNSASASQVMHYSSDTHVGMPTITFENPGSDNAYSKAEIAQGHAGTVTATVHAAADAQVGEHLSINGVDHILDANSLAHGINLEVAPSSIVRAIMTDEHGNVNSALNIAASAKPEPIVVTAPPGSHHIGASLGVPTLIPTQTPVPSAQQGWKILVNGHYQTSYTSQWGTLTINPKTGQLNYQEHADTHTGPHGSAQNVGVHEDRFEVALQGSHHDDVIMHVQVSILSRGPGHSGKLTLGSEVLDMTVTPTFSHPAPPPPPPAADANDVPQNDASAEISVNLDDIVVDDAAVHTEQQHAGQDTQSSDDATAQVQTEAETESTSQPLSPTPVTAAAATAPIDHYLQMVGMNQQDLAPQTDSPAMSALPSVQELSSSATEADMLDTNQADAFANPLDDDDKHGLHHTDLTPVDELAEHQVADQANDDELLHQALNDMHNQL
ncbi:VCBS domain-containing protein, partial [Shewanella sp. 10N.286.54.B9]|uniref:VCBS domain-containing protein n=2 Tax=Gammaproteobacteria TaxID=1236 RepID=UPI0035537567